VADLPAEKVKPHILRRGKGERPRAKKRANRTPEDHLKLDRREKGKKAFNAPEKASSEWRVRHREREGKLQHCCTPGGGALKKEKGGTSSLSRKGKLPRWEKGEGSHPTILTKEEEGPKINAEP